MKRRTECVCIVYMHFSPLESFEGDLTSGSFSAAPGDQPHHPTTTEESGLIADLHYELASADDMFEWSLEIFEGCRYLVAHCDSHEITCMQVGEVQEADLEGLVLCENLEGYIAARYADVRRLRPHDKTLTPNQKEWEGKSPKGLPETKREFLVRVLLHGEDVEPHEFREQVYPLKSTEYAPGEYIAVAARSALIEEEGQTVRKVLTRRRYQPKPGAISVHRQEERDVEFLEKADRDSMELKNLYKLDEELRTGNYWLPIKRGLRSKVGEMRGLRGRDMDWLLYPDLLSSWHDGETQ